MKRIISLSFMLGLLNLSVFAQELDKAKLDSYFEALESNNRFMGSVAVSKNGNIIYSNTIGFADYENKIEANENTKYRIGSISKTFTAVLVLKAIEKKKLNLNQTIEKFFPGIKNAEKITIEHLLYHRSGIFNFTNDEDFLTWNTVEKTESELVEIITKGGSDFEPDAKADYSNSNYLLLTFILEKVFEKSYAELLEEYITSPIQLENTFLGGPINIQNNESYSYRFTGHWEPETETDISIPLGAGGIISTAADVVKFSDALFSGKLLKAESLKQMKTLKDNFGIGLFQIPFYDYIGLGHTGGIDGFTSVFSYFPEGNISYALVSNGTNFNNNDISIAVLSAIFNRPYDIPEFNTYEVNAEDLEQYLGVYSSVQLQLKITIIKESNTLIAQATGQSSFPLEAMKKDKFKFDPAGVVIEFNPSENILILKQGGGEFPFVKE
ncbi:MAG: class A beta-lactamase-related serine hydrolase [Chitinophagaceae bacterium]|nr:MAG: class A beta-lactamase-related serine hydrolase [Chitinophagaceae bacterium]